MKSNEDKKRHYISEDLSGGGLNNSTNSITSFNYDWPDQIYRSWYWGWTDAFPNNWKVSSV